MSDNEKLTGASGVSEDGNADGGAKAKTSEFSIDSILAEYASSVKSEPSAKAAPDEADYLAGKEAEVKALFDEVVVKGNTPSDTLSNNGKKNDSPDAGNTVVFGTTSAVGETGETVKITGTHSVKELFDAINEITGTTDKVSAGKEDDDADDVRIYGSEEAESEPEDVYEVGEELPTAKAEDESTAGTGTVDRNALFGEDGERDPMFADVGFDEFESEAKQNGKITPESDAFNSAKENIGNDAGEKVKSGLETLFGSTTGSNPIVRDGDGYGNGKKKQSKRAAANEILHREEADFSSEQGINRSLGFMFKKSRLALLSVIGTGFFFLLSILYSLSANFFPISDFLKPGTYSAVYILVDLQIMFFAAMCALDKLIEGAVDLYDRFGSPECVTLVMTLMITAYSVYGAVTCKGNDEVYTFGSVGCFALFLVSLYDYYKSTSDYLSFRIAASPASKYGSVELDPTGDDCAPFQEYMTAGSKAFTIQKGEKYLNFTSRNETVPKCENGFGVKCALSFFVSLAVGAAVYVFSTFDLYVALTSALVIFLSSISFGTYLAAALPRYLLAKKASRHNCAIVGQNVHEEYENVSVISFEDTEVFPPKDVRVSSIRVYGNTALDSAILDIAFISKKLGGPLSNVFAKAVTYDRSDLDNVEILAVYPDAIKAAIGKNEYLLATSAFLRANGFACYEDSVDNSYITSLGSILYMVKNNETVAKFYIKYAINPQFETILSGLNDADICVSVRTADPCINNDILLSNLRGKNHKISVVKGSGIGSLPSTSKNIDSGIISLSGIHNFLKTYILCDRLGRTIKVNSIVKAMGTVFGFVIPIALFALNFMNPAGTVHIVNSLFVLLIQLFWLVPIAVISRFYK